MWYWTILSSIFQYLNASNNITCHLAIQAISNFFILTLTLTTFSSSRTSFRSLKMSTQDANGQYWSLQDNISQCLTILGNIWQYLNVPDNITTQTRVGWNIHLSNIEQYWTIFEGNIGQYLTKFCNIGQYLTILGNMGQLESISKCS